MTCNIILGGFRYFGFNFKLYYLEPNEETRKGGRYISRVFRLSR